MKKFQEAWDWQQSSEIPFLLEQHDVMERKKPYLGLSIYHNAPLSMESLCKIDALMAAGADVTVAINQSIQPASQKQAIDYLEKENIAVNSFHHVEKEYDFYLDCGAELADMPLPRYGIVELTQTGASVYKKKSLSIPVVSVDDSYTKRLETFFGTADGLVRAFEALTGKQIKGLNVLLFGFGKIGKGITQLLHSSNEVRVVDVQENSLNQAKEKGLVAYPFHEKEAITSYLPKVDLVITATGVKDLISAHFPKTSFEGKYLANLGVEDEFGKEFSAQEVLHEKQPINFFLKNPTQMRYLDPIFYAHNEAPHWILEKTLPAGFHPLPEEEDQKILERWQSLHREEIMAIYQ